MVLSSFPQSLRNLLSPVLSSPRLTDVVFLVGLFALTSSVVSVVQSIVSGVVGVLKGGRKLASLGKWAVITGATDGIGKAYAEQLAKMGMSVVLVSRTQGKLDDVAKEIADKYKVETKTIAVDFGAFSPEVATKVKAVLDPLEVGVIVNNVGVSYDYPEYYDKIDQSAIWNMHRLNIDSTAVMTHIVLPGMVSRKKGAVINVSSGAGFIPMGLLSIYSASKAYVDFFSRALSQEYASRGITVQSVLPFMVVSKLSKVRKSSALVPTPEQYVRASLQTVGKEERTFGYWSHKVEAAVLEMLPSSWAEGYLFKMHAGIRKAALKKKERLAAEGKKQ